MEFHPLANIFPLMTERELSRLADDIAVNGQLDPIDTYQGRILDGRSRFLACRKIVKEPRLRQWEGNAGAPGEGGDPLAYVIARNLHRRHLGESQRAIVAARLATLALGQHPYHSGEGSAQVVAAQRSGDTPIGVSQNETRCAATVAQAAQLLNVGEMTVSRARRVLAHGDPSLLAAVEEGIVSINDAAKVVERSKAIQQAAIEAVRAGTAKTAAKAAEKIEPTNAEDKQSANTGGTRLPRAPHVALPDMTDGLGEPVPAEYQAVFAARGQFRTIVVKFNEVRQAVEQLAESPAGIYLRHNLSPYVQKFKEFEYLVSHSAPYAVTPAKRKEPKWVSEIAWRTLPEEERSRR